MFNKGNEVVCFYTKNLPAGIEFGEMYVVAEDQHYSDWLILEGFNKHLRSDMFCSVDDFYNDFCND